MERTLAPKESDKTIAAAIADIRAERVKREYERKRKMDNLEIKKTLFAFPPKKEGGWRKELNLVSRYGKEPVYDLREWSEDHSKMSKGITLTNSELMILKEKLQEVEL